MIEVKKPDKVDFHLRCFPSDFGSVNSPDDAIDVYLKTDFGIIHFRASKEITDKQKEEVYTKMISKLESASKYLDFLKK
ncbi:unnamed protein product [Fructobacillus tropaeoli]|uniref:hypothetical protein n=1 Tax=Fructobacillus tropaeoli TaxID=709323 RepID=UPI002D8FE181|nr:unnamed protein product [Fructobacillus tropaeoli]